VALIVPSIIGTIGFSGNYKGAWIYRAAPIKETKDIFKGTMKASVINLILPLYILISIIFMIIFKGEIFLDLIVIFLNVLLFIVICFNLTTKRLPFSEPFEEANKGRSFTFLYLFLILGALAGAHYVSTMFNYGIILFIIVLAISNIFAWEKGFNVGLGREIT